VGDVHGLVWRLEGTALRDVRCWILETQSGEVAVRVIHGDETMLDEMYPDMRTAMSRAERLESDLVKAGWSVTRE
jgi:hypothetical protein